MTCVPLRSPSPTALLLLHATLYKHEPIRKPTCISITAKECLSDLERKENEPRSDMRTGERRGKKTKQKRGEEETSKQGEATLASPGLLR